ncbi:MAG: hypothetical protein ABJO86_13210 [Lentilitoribacter sp.]
MTENKSTALRKISVIGPGKQSNPLWKLDTHVLYDSSSGRLVDHASDLHSLSLSGETRTIKVGEKSVQFDPPSLLRARIDMVKGGPADKQIPTGSSHETLFTPHRRDDSFKPHNIGFEATNTFDTILRPLNDEWPDPKPVGEGFEITVPEFRLVTGGISFQAKPKTGLAKFLHYSKNRNTVFSGIKLHEDKKDGVAVTLVPEGIELNVHMPHPFADMNTSKTAETIPVRVRIEPDGDSVIARLVEVLIDNPSELSSDLRKILGALEAKAAPLRAVADTRAQVPPFAWLLELDSTGLHVKPLKKKNGVAWRIRVDPDILTLRLETELGPASNQPAIARLDDASRPGDPNRSGKLILTRFFDPTSMSHSTVLQYETFSTNNSDDGHLSALYVLEDENDFKFQELESTGPIDAYLPVEEIAERRPQIGKSKEENNTSTGYAILPVANGTLQINSEGFFGTDPLPNEKQSRPAMQGNCVFAFNQERKKPILQTDQPVLMLDGANDARVAVTWSKKKADEVRLDFWVPQGSFRQAIWSAEEAATSTRLLPTARRDPAMVREIVVTFGPGQRSNCKLSLMDNNHNVSSGSTTTGGWELELNRQTDITELKPQTETFLWQSAEDLPLISAAPMLSDLGVNDKPDELRSLVPCIIKNNVILAGDASKSLPFVKNNETNEVIDTWPWPEIDSADGWGKASVQLVSPTAPGLDYTPGNSSVENDVHALLLNNIQTSLRYDLPILDELFAQPTGEKIPGSDKTNPLGPVLGVMDMEAMAQLWDERAIGLATTRTQNARATGWAFQNAKIQGPKQLAEPYDTSSEIEFSADYQIESLKSDILLGSYTLNWDGASSINYSGENSLLGPQGTDGPSLKLSLTEDNKLHPNGLKDPTLTIAGFAPDAYSNGTDGILVDTRGTGMKSVSEHELKTAVITRSSSFQKSIPELIERELFTLVKAIEVVGFKNDVEIWVRDLPLVDQVFQSHSSGHAIEGRHGPDPSQFERGNLQDALYEWRLYSAAKPDVPAQYSLPFKELKLTPLRLLTYAPHKTEGEALEILFRSELNLNKTNDGSDPFGAELIYTTGPLISLGFEKSDTKYSLSKIQRMSLDLKESSQLDRNQLRLKSSENAKIAFTLEAGLITKFAGYEVNSNTYKNCIAIIFEANLSEKINSNNALNNVTLKMKLLGHLVTLNVEYYDDGDEKGYKLSNAAPSMDDSLSISDLRLIHNADLGWQLTVQLSAQLRMGPNQPYALWAMQDKIGWMGLPLVPAEDPRTKPFEIRVDNERGAIWIEYKTIKPPLGTPIDGISFSKVNKFNYSAVLVLSNSALDGRWNVSTASVQALIKGKNGTTSLGLRSHSFHENGETKTTLYLDRDTSIKSDAPNKSKKSSFQTSGISWDPKGLEITDDPNNLTGGLSITTKKNTTYQHEISATLLDHELPVDALDQQDIDKSVTLTKPISLNLLLRHRLINGKDEILSWRMLETTIITTQNLWSKRFDQKDDLHTYGPRYVTTNADYRDTAQPRPFAGGVGSRQAMLSGFDDLQLARRISNHSKDRADVLLMLGGGVGIVQTGAEIHKFDMPWVSSFDPAEELPTAFSGLMRFPKTKAQWTATKFDTTPFNPMSGTLPPVASAPTGLVNGIEIKRFLENAANDISASDKLTAVSRSVTQAYVESVSEPETPPEEWPLFLPALIALQKTLEMKSESKRQWLSLHPVTNGSAIAVHVPADDIVAHTPAPSNSPQFFIVAIDKGNQFQNFTLDTPAHLKSLNDVEDNFGAVHLAEQAATRLVSPKVAILVETNLSAIPEEDSSNPFLGRIVRALHIRLPETFEEFGSPQQRLINPSDQVYPSPALGWPEKISSDETNKSPERFVMQGKADAPVISIEAGLAARSAALGLKATYGQSKDDANILATQARSLFHHGSKTAYEQVSLPAPPARHLALLAPRVRTPLPAAREAALKKIATTNEQETSELFLSKGIGLVPPAYSRSFIGARPGILETHIDAVITDGARSSAPMDNAQQRFGRSATIASPMARQLRTPRSPALPMEKTFDANSLKSRRRTYVSLFDYQTEMADIDKDRHAKTFVYRQHASAMWRLYNEPKESVEEGRFFLDLKSGTILPENIIQIQKTGGLFKLNMELAYKGIPTINNMEALKNCGFLCPLNEPDKPAMASLRAWIAIGAERFDAQIIDWETESGDNEEQIIKIDLGFLNLDMPRLLNLLSNPDPDAPSDLHLQFRKPSETDVVPFSDKGSASIAPAETGDELIDGEPFDIKLPIGRKPFGRATPEISYQTFFFSDPAYDRMLSSPGKSSQVIRLKDGTATAVALDRTEYDLSQTLFLAFGKLTENGFDGLTSNDDELTLNLKQLDEAGQPKTVPLMLEGFDPKKKFDDKAPLTPRIYPVQSNKVYALPLSRLAPTDPSLSIKAGDRLQIEVFLKQEQKTLSVEVPLSEQVDDPRPAAIYSVVQLTKDGDQFKSKTLLHAAAPSPDRVQFIDLKGDLAKGHIRKRAIFQWRSADFTSQKGQTHYTLTKTDRSGGAQMPRGPNDFQPKLDEKD